MKPTSHATTNHRSVPSPVAGPETIALGSAGRAQRVCTRVGALTVLVLFAACGASKPQLDEADAQTHGREADNGAFNSQDETFQSTSTRVSRADRLAALESQPCSRRRAEEEMRIGAEGRGPQVVPSPQLVEARFIQCFEVELAGCQLAIDESIAHGIEACKSLQSAEVPDHLKTSDVAEIAPCLQRVKREQEELQRCITTTEPKRDELRCPLINGQETCGRSRDSFMKERATCIKARVPAVQSCPLVTVAGGWAKFRQAIKLDDSIEEARAAACTFDMVQVAMAVREQDVGSSTRRLAEASEFCTTEAEQKKLAQLSEHVAALRAAIDKRTAAQAVKQQATARCGGTFTFEVAINLRFNGPLKNTRGCRYQVIGEVINSASNLVLLTNDRRQAGAQYVLRTREVFVDGTVFMGQREASFAGVRRVQFTDGSYHALPAFDLLP